MKSTIRIEYDFDTKQPVLRIVQDKQSDDLRDQMLLAYVQQASATNSTLYIAYPEYTGRSDNSIVEIRCEEKPVLSLLEQIDAVEIDAKRIIWSNSPQDLKFIKEFCDILRERVK